LLADEEQPITESTAEAISEDVQDAADAVDEATETVADAADSIEEANEAIAEVAEQTEEAVEAVEEASETVAEKGGKLSPERKKGLRKTKSNGGNSSSLRFSSKRLRSPS